MSKQISYKSGKENLTFKKENVKPHIDRRFIMEGKTEMGDEKRIQTQS